MRLACRGQAIGTQISALPKLRIVLPTFHTSSPLSQDPEARIGTRSPGKSSQRSTPSSLSRHWNFCCIDTAMGSFTPCPAASPWELAHSVGSHGTRPCCPPGRCTDEPRSSPNQAERGGPSSREMGRTNTAVWQRPMRTRFGSGKLNPHWREHGKAIGLPSNGVSHACACKGQDLERTAHARCQGPVMICDHDNLRCI